MSRYVFYTLRFCEMALLVIIFMASGCQHKPTGDLRISAAEDILFARPDSAYKILLSIPHPETLSQQDYAAWCLHYIHARYKLDMDISSDSMAASTLKYYQKNYSPKYTGIAWYLYANSVESTSEPQAMNAYKRAYDCLGNTREYELSGLVSFSIASLYDHMKEYTISVKYIELALSYFRKSGNLKYQAYCYNAKSDLYLKLGYPKKRVLKYLDRTIVFAKQSQDTLIYFYTLSHKAELLFNIDYVQSKKLFLQVFSHLPLRKTTNAAYLSYLYSQLGKLDSASYYRQIASKNTNQIDRNIYYLFNALAEKNSGDFEQAFNTLELAYNINDSIYQASNANQLARLDKQYDLTQKVRENDRLKIANQWNTIVIFALLVLVLSGVVIFLIVRDRMRKKQALLEVRNKELEIENRHKAYVNEQKRQALLVKLHAQIKNTLQFQRLQVGYHESKKHEEFLAAITRQSVIGTTEWDFYIREVNQLSDGRLQRLREEAHQLTAQDVIVICLICLGLDINRSCSLLNMTVNTMYQRRKRIKMRVGFKEDIELWAKTTIGDWDVEAVDPDKLWVLDE